MGGYAPVFQVTADRVLARYEGYEQETKEKSRLASAIHKTALADYDRLKAFLSGATSKYEGHGRLLYDSEYARNSTEASPSPNDTCAVSPRVGSHYPHIERALGLRRKRLGQEGADVKPTFNQRSLQSPVKTRNKSPVRRGQSPAAGKLNAVSLADRRGMNSEAGSEAREAWSELESVKSPLSVSESVMGQRGSMASSGQWRNGVASIGHDQPSRSKDSALADKAHNPNAPADPEDAMEARFSMSPPQFMRPGFRTSVASSNDLLSTEPAMPNPFNTHTSIDEGVRSSRQIRASFIKKCREQFLAVQAREEAATTIQSVARMYITRRWLIGNWGDLQRMKAAGDFRRAKMMRMCLRLWSRYHKSRSRLMQIMLHRRFKAHESFLGVCMQPFNAGELLLSVGKYGMATAYYERKLKLKSLLAIFFFAAFGEQGERFWSMKKQVGLAQSMEFMSMPPRASAKDIDSIVHVEQRNLDKMSPYPASGIANNSIDSSVYFKAGIPKGDTGAKRTTPVSRPPVGNNRKPDFGQSSHVTPHISRRPPSASGKKPPTLTVKEENSRNSLGRMSSRAPSSDGSKSVLESISPSMSPPRLMPDRSRTSRHSRSPSNRSTGHRRLESGGGSVPGRRNAGNDESEGSDIEDEFQRFMRARQEKEERWMKEEAALRKSTEEALDLANNNSNKISGSRKEPSSIRDRPASRASDSTPQHNFAAEKPRKASTEWQPFKEWRPDGAEVLYESSDTSENFSFAGDEWVPNEGRVNKYGGAAKDGTQGQPKLSPRQRGGDQSQGGNPRLASGKSKGERDAPLSLMQRLEQQTLMAMMDSSDSDFDNFDDDE